VSEHREPYEGPAPNPWAGVLLTLAGLGLLAALVLLVDPLRDGVGEALSGDTAALREELGDLTIGSALIVLALALVHTVLWYPAEILDAAVGYVYGFWVGLPLIMVAWLANAVAAWYIGSHAARPVLDRWLGGERFERLEQLAENGGVTLLLTVRLIPVIPFSLFSAVAGAARVPLGRLLWTTAVGYLPLTALFVYLGSRLEELSPTDPIIWITAAVLIAFLLLGRRLRDMVGESG
jgi:uncharacterized membrane protein YdjX (TVP38/TMEM64 family)